ncbi:MAG: hydratase [Gammaproteobacteria bacterium]|nr:hydratase [Gammaproteobacteria bacterium]
MTDDRIREAGRRLGEAWLAARPADAYPETLRARSRTEAYAIQDAMAAVIGQPVTGWKLGATSPTMRARAGHDGAIIGRVFESVTFDTPAELSMARFPDSRVECEFAFRMRNAITPRPQPWTAVELAERAELHVAVEIIGNRYPKGAEAFKPLTNDEIADNGAGIGFVFGPAITDWRRHDLRNLFIDIRIDGGEPAENFLGECRCDPIEALVQAAGILGERGIAIEADQYVSTGAATDPQPVRAGSAVQARFATLGTIDIVFVD